MTTRSMNDVRVRQLAPLLMVWSMEASLHFYVDGLGFAVTHTWTPDGKVRWCWIEQGGAALMLQEWTADDPRRETLKGRIGEGVGFFKCSAGHAPEYIRLLEESIRETGGANEYEDALHRLLAQVPVGWVDVTGLPWTEVDFAEDLRRAEMQVLPEIERLGP